MLFALVLCGFLVVGVPILVLATAPGAHADAWGGLGETPSSGQAGSAAAGEDLGEPAGVQPTGTPGPAPWDAEATTTLQLRSGLEAPEPVQPQSQPHESASDRQDRGGTPLPTPNLGHLLLTRDPDSDDQLLAQAPDRDDQGDGRGNGDPPRIGQARPGGWTLHIVGLEALTDHPDPIPAASSDPGRPDQVTAADQRPAAATSFQPDQDRERATLVIADGDLTWVQLAAGSALPAGTSLRAHLGSQLPERTSAPVATSSGAIGQPPATVAVVQLPAQPPAAPGTPPAVAPNAQAPLPQQAQAIPTGRVAPAHDAFLPGLPQTTVVLTAAPIPAGSLATGTQAVVGAAAGDHRGQPDQPGSARLVLDVGDGSRLGRLPARGSVLLLPHAGRVPLAPDGTPLVTPLQLPAGAAALVADAQTSRVLRAGIAGWDSENWEYLAAAALLIGALVVASSGVAFLGLPATVVIIGALLGAGTSVAIQKLTTGRVSWTQTALISVAAGVTAGLGYGADALLAGTTFWNWFAYWQGPGGITLPRRLPGWWPRYEARVYNFEAPGTVAWRDVAVHEGFHALVAEHKYAGIVTWLGYASIGPVPVGAPIFYAEEVIGRAIGHLAVGRLHAVVLTPFDAFASLEPAQRVTTVMMGLAGLSAQQATRRSGHDKASDTLGDTHGRKTQDRREGTSP